MSTYMESMESLATRCLRDLRLKVMLQIKLQELQRIQAQIAKAEGRDPKEEE